ncbi:zinc finger CCHC domain-containing protein 8 homolog [Aricia agestis]|uniref:zinc finger CCHC domain-containing protein 8 homolog n=1 Tax=Aricia agestis TaxID=91739 RepID=UPI001C2074C7|nr:zinc finger CCHC domain-containing protein 8 homolog [Aricia agestis]
MAKRKAGVNDIIYELDNDDIEISSDDECKESKKKVLKADAVSAPSENADSKKGNEEICDVVDITEDLNSTDQSQSGDTNGGKTDDNIVQINIDTNDITFSDDDSSKKNVDESNTILFNEDMVIDSPASNTDLGVVGCENRTPLVTIRFKDTRLANTYKKQVKEFLLRLIQLNCDHNIEEDGDDTDIELDIWPEDLEETKETSQPIEEEDNIFFIDTAPCDNEPIEIPKYSQVTSLISNSPEKVEESPRLQRRGPICFNCDGEHALRDCSKPRDHVRIAEKRRNMGPRVGRYHVEDDQKYGHLVPGRISGQLRHALGLKRNELPMYIYRMRMLGYPPGWLEEARISHSGIAMFDSTGSAILDPEEEDGECCEPGSKDKFDIKKILDFPGFNVPASSRYVEEGHLYGIPPISDQDSKLAMLQTLAPNAMKAYKRKKLTFFPSAERNSLQGQAEMELDSGDEATEFPSVPPLPDEAPPPPPPPPASPPPASPLKSSPSKSKDKTSPPKDKTSPSEDNISIEDEITNLDDSDVIILDEVNSASDVEITDVMKVMDIPIPEEDLITLDEISDTSILDNSADSLTLDDLEKKKAMLLNALEGDVGNETLEIVDTDQELDNDETKTETENISEEIESKAEDSKTETPQQQNSAGDQITPSVDRKNSDNMQTPIADRKQSNEDMKTPSTDRKEKQNETEKTPSLDRRRSDADLKTPDSKAGCVKTTSYGTPVVNSCPYSNLPSGDKFAKDICDVINFENLPNSTGKYKKICSLLKKVKSEVDRIQDS